MTVRLQVPKMSAKPAERKFSVTIFLGGVRRLMAVVNPETRRTARNFKPQGRATQPARDLSESVRAA